MWLELLSGAGLLLAGMGIGRRQRTPKPKADAVPLCTCEHYLSSHDPETMRCTENEDRTWVPSTKSWVTVPCPCKQYVGPKPIDTFYTPQLLPPADG